jgi:CysZ protein
VLPARPPPGTPLALRPAPGRGLVLGLRSLFSGFGFVLTTPAVWPLALVPVVLAVGITALLGGAAVGFLPAKVAAWVGATSTLGKVGAVALQVLATALAVALAAVLGFSLAQPLAGPALNGIVRRAEALEGAPEWPPTGFWQDMVRGLSSVAIAYALGLPILAALLAVNFFFPPAAVVTVPLKMLTVALMIAWDLCDYPLSLRGLPVRTRLAFAWKNLPALVGFGIGFALLSLLPCALLLALPAGVAGAARLLVRLERAEGNAPVPL